MTITGQQHSALTTRSALTRCLAIDRVDFLDNYFGRRLLHTRAAELPEDFTDLMSKEAVNQILSSGGLRTSSLRLVRDDHQLDPANYGLRGGGDRPGESPYVDPERVASAFRNGYSLVLRSLHRHHRPLIGFAHDLAAELGYPVHINAYVTPPGTQAVKTHYDTHDVLVLQIAGEKTWEIRTPVLSDPLAGQAWQELSATRRSHLLSQSEPLRKLTLRPGDSFHLPRGFLHAARASTSVSVQLTVAIQPTTRHDLLKSLIAVAQEHEWFRQRIPMHRHDTVESDIASLLPELADRLAVLAAPGAAAQVLRQLDDVRWVDLPPEPVPVLPPANPRSYVRRAGARYWTDEAEGRLTVHVGALHASLPADAQPAVQHALSTSPLDPARPPGTVAAQDWQRILNALSVIGILIPKEEPC